MRWDGGYESKPIVWKRTALQIPTFCLSWQPFWTTEVHSFDPQTWSTHTYIYTHTQPNLELEIKKNGDSYMFFVIPSCMCLLEEPMAFGSFPFSGVFFLWWPKRCPWFSKKLHLRKASISRFQTATREFVHWAGRVCVLLKIGWKTNRKGLNIRLVRSFTVNFWIQQLLEIVVTKASLKSSKIQFALMRNSIMMRANESDHKFEDDGLEISRSSQDWFSRTPSILKYGLYRGGWISPKVYWSNPSFPHWFWQIRVCVSCKISLKPGRQSHPISDKWWILGSLDPHNQLVNT